MGIKDVVENDVSGILTDEDVKLYAKATIELLKNEGKRLELSKNAKNSGAVYSFIKTGEKLGATSIKKPQIRTMACNSSFGVAFHWVCQQLAS